MTRYREAADDILHLELSFLLETPTDGFHSILMYFEHNFFFIPQLSKAIEKLQTSLFFNVFGVPVFSEFVIQIK